MRYIRFSMGILLLFAGVAALYIGLVLGEWGETLFNATLL
jgi:hypothetical protein